MRKNNNSLKWIYFVPLSIFMYFFGYILIRIVIALIVMLFFPALPVDGNQYPDYGGHYLYATILVMLKDGIPTGFAIVFGVKLVPKYKPWIFTAFVTVWIGYILFNLIATKNTGYSTLNFYLLIISIVGQLICIIFAGYILVKEQLSKEKNCKTDLYNPYHIKRTANSNF